MDTMATTSAAGDWIPKYWADKLTSDLTPNLYFNQLMIDPVITTTSTSITYNPYTTAAEPITETPPLPPLTFKRRFRITRDKET